MTSFTAVHRAVVIYLDDAGQEVFRVDKQLDVQVPQAPGGASAGPAAPKYPGMVQLPAPPSEDCRPPGTKAAPICPPPCPPSAPPADQGHCVKEKIASKHASRLPQLQKELVSLTARVEQTADDLQKAYDDYVCASRVERQRREGVINRLSMVQENLKHLAEVQYDPMPRPDSDVHPLRKWRFTKPVKVEYQREPDMRWKPDCPKDKPRRSVLPDDVSCSSGEYLGPPEKEPPREDIAPQGLDAVRINHEPLWDLANRFKGWQCAAPPPPKRCN